MAFRRCTVAQYYALEDAPREMYLYAGTCVSVVFSGATGGQTMPRRPSRLRKHACKEREGKNVRQVPESSTLCTTEVSAGSSITFFWQT